MSALLEFYAPCPRGVEALLGDELRALRVQRVRPLAGGVSFWGDLEDAYRALLWSRLASRVLLVLARVAATSSEELYASVAELAWEEHVRAGGTVAVDAGGTNEALRNTQFVAVRVKDAVADRFVARFGRRPSVDVRDPDVRVNVALRKDRATISIDLAGTALHRRGYREPGAQVEAPMKETLAAAVLTIAGWPGIAGDGGAFVDPLCGSGTLPIEAAMIAGDTAPGLLRTRWGFDRWLGHDAAAWERVHAEARERRDAGVARLPVVAGFDADPRAVDLARSCVRRAGLERHVTIERRQLASLAVPARARPDAGGLVATNPPYGERITARSGLPALYAEMASRLRAGFDGWTLAVITPDTGLSKGLGMTPERVAELYNGKIRSAVSVFVVSAERPPATTEGSALAEDAPAARTPSSEAFENRLRKMVRHREKWARRAGVSCVRVYDADLPDYAVAIDVYGGARADAGRRWVHIAEYAPPAEIDPVLARRRVDEVRAIAAEVLGVAQADVFLKRRERQRGVAQYERVSERGAVRTIEEGGLAFEVNLSDYLDTGIFLDHRMTRAWLAERAQGTRFLNLFAYTATASVYAAAGGAVSTTSVDLSATYAEWARRNLALNGFGSPDHQVERADVLEWVEAARRESRSFDLIFCDPPTFSNSKRMRATWDVQRDHAELISAVASLLAQDGLLVFSCNRKGFALDGGALERAGLVAEDMTARTIPPDFERRTPHVCFAIRHARGHARGSA